MSKKYIPNIYKLGFYGFLFGNTNIDKNTLRDTYLNMLLILSAQLHQYKTPDFNKYFYEIAINTGVAAFYKCKEKSSVNYNRWCCTPAKPASVIDNMMLADKITTTGSDYSVELTVNKDCILLYNNSAMFPDMLSVICADDLTENQLSMSKLVKWSRMTPIPKAKTDADIAKLTLVMKRILEGEDINVVSDDLNLLLDSHTTIDDNVLRLTDESAVEKLHFFDQHYDQLLKRYATIKGLPFSTTAKNAQSLVDELHDMDVFSTFIITDTIECRKEGFKRAAEFMKETEGIDFDFEYIAAELLKKQIERPKTEFKAEDAEAERILNEAEKNQAEAEKDQSEAEKNQAEADAITDQTTEDHTAEDHTAEDQTAEDQTDEDESEEGDEDDPEENSYTD